MGVEPQKVETSVHSGIKKAELTSRLNSALVNSAYSHTLIIW